jgi:polyisoprenoid-binding protein YceI
MKNYIILLLILIVVSVGGFVAKNYNDSKKLAAEPTVFEQAENEVKVSALTDGVYSVDTLASILNWQASKLFIDGYTDSGTIGLQEGSVEVVDGLIARGEFIIDMNTITSLVTGSGGGQDGLTRHLKSEDFFDVAKFGTASLALESVTPVENTTYLVAADLTIKGITNPIKFEAEIYTTESGSVRALAEVILDRTLWDVKFGSGKFFTDLGDKVIDDNFKLELDLVAKNS